MDIDALEFQQLDYHQFLTLVDWAGKEGWNPGPYDAEIYWNTDPEGYYGYTWGGELIAGGSIVSYNGAFGFMGFFIVHPDYRGKGIGNKLWYQRRNKLLSRLNPGAVIGMDGVVEMQPFYTKGGFGIAFCDERYTRMGQNFEVHSAISAIVEDDFQQIMDYDRICFGFDRPQFMKLWLFQPESNAFKFIENGQLKGFALMRRLHEGYKICPLFADNLEIASALYEACLSTHPGEPIIIDIPLNNPAAIKLIREYQAEYTFECARMYYGAPPKNDWYRVFGITSFELG